MVETLEDSYDDITALLDDAVDATAEYESWEARGIEYRIEGDGVAYDREFTQRLLALGYVPVSCSADRLVLGPIRPTVGD